MDAITALVLVETGKEVLIRQSNEDVTSSTHQDLLDEVSLLGIPTDLRSGQRCFHRICDPYPIGKVT
jgi:hypothetical protein